MNSKPSDIRLEFRVPWECSVGVLFNALHRGNALAPIQAELEDRARVVGLFDDAGVTCVMLDANVNTRIGRHRVQPTSVAVDSRWRMLDKETYWAHVDVDLAAWTPKSRERTPEQALAGAMPILAYAGWLGFAQAAVELGVISDRVEEFLAGSPVLPNDLVPRSRRRRQRTTRAELLEVQVLSRAVHPNDQLMEYHRISDILVDAASRGKLGSYEGSSSSDEHFEFAFSVANLAEAKQRFLAALIAGNIDSDAISFHTEPKFRTGSGTASEVK
jgi:hypothetical protein